MIVGVTVETRAGTGTSRIMSTAGIPKGFGRARTTTLNLTIAVHQRYFLYTNKKGRN